jgi:SAM-dependent methyltransferase
MNRPASLPEAFLRELRALEASYLQRSDPIEQSGFGGGSERWRAERELIFDAVTVDGDLLDIGCANGYLLECLIAWGQERGISIIPYGLDLGARLIALARQRHPRFAEHFFVGNAWDWEPPRRFRYVYTLLDAVPPDYLPPHLHRLLASVVAPGGRLITGDYGSHSRGFPARDVEAILRSAGLTAAGSATAGDGIARFAWVDAGP